MEKIKIGSICITKIDKAFEYNNQEELIKKGTYVVICDDDNADKGYVLVEIEGYDTVFGYKIDELTLIKNNF